MYESQTSNMSRDMTKPAKWLCAQRRLRSCSYWVINLSFCFQLIPFLENSLFSVHITNVTSTIFWKKRSCVWVWVCFAPNVPNVGSRYSKFGFEKKQQHAFGFEKKKKKKTAEVGFLGSISQTRRKCICEHWTTGAGWGPLRLFYGKRVLAILKTCSTRLELRNYSRMFTNL